MSGSLVEVSLVIFKACLLKNLIELANPHDLAYKISVLRVAGPGIPALISSSFPIELRCFSQFSNDLDSKKKGEICLDLEIYLKKLEETLTVYFEWKTDKNQLRRLKL